MCGAPQMQFCVQSISSCNLYVAMKYNRGINREVKTALDLGKTFLSNLCCMFSDFSLFVYSSKVLCFKCEKVRLEYRLWQ